ncbi:fibronectin type III domain-containing protein [Actinoplanes sp. NPDC049599]|uniref:fibronectin type III domain-containing protein n=1 Tax=Actinoplanes sp. NPDC049599 TaxID=3363903 RepID=UPI0037A5C46F
MSSDRWHAVLGLGTDGGQPLSDGDTLARGVHLLWTLRPELGFPVDGYHVSRRRHRPPEWVCLDASFGLLPPPGGVTEWDNGEVFTLECDPGGATLDPDGCVPVGAARYPGADRSLTIRADREFVALRAAGEGNRPTVEVFADVGGEERLVARRRAARRGADSWFVEVWAEGVASCRLTGDDLTVCTVCWGIADETSGWQRLHDERILLPVVEPDTGNLPQNLQDRNATEAVAYGRLAAGLDEAVRERLATAFAGEVGPLLETLVRDGRGALVPAEATASATSRTPPLLTLPIAQFVALAALDPDVSRMLGLYWHDPVADGSWDYRVVAHHGDARFPSRLVTVDGLPLGAAGTPTVTVDGLTFVGNAGLTVVDGGDQRVLRVEEPVLGTAAGVRLGELTPRVTLRVSGPLLLPLVGWRGGLQVASGVAALGVATLEEPTGIDTVTWSAGPVTVRSVELFERAGTVGDRTAYAWNLSPVPPPPVQPLRVIEAGAAAEPARLEPDGTVAAHTGALGVDWAETSAVEDEQRPVRAHVGRSPAEQPLRVVNADRPAPAFGPAPATSHWTGPDVPRRWVERGLPPGTYAVAVRGVDAFGRLSEWSEQELAGMPAGTVPPPPEAVTAAYLDPADSLLTDEQRALADRDGPGLLVGWTWPAERRVATPGVEPNGEFRVYARRGDPNLIVGNVLAVTDLGDRSRLRTDCALPEPPDAIAGEKLRVGGASFPILTGRAGGVIEVAHLTAPTVRPGAGPCSVRLAEGGTAYTELTISRGFGQLVRAEPVGALPTHAAVIGAVVPAGDTAIVTLDRPLPPWPADIVAGRLVSGGVAFRVVAQRPGSRELELRATTAVDGAVAWPVTGQRCTVWPGRRYAAWLPGAGHRPEAAERLAETLVAVSTADLDAIVLHEPVPPGPRRARDGAGPGLEGPLSRVARVSVPHRQAPPAVPVALPPEMDGDIPADRAEPADWYGRARYVLSFAAVPSATGYRVGRASVAALFENDRVSRQTGLAPYAAGPFDDGGASEAWLAEHHPDVSVADLTELPPAPGPRDGAENPGPSGAGLEVRAAWRGWAAWFYAAKLNRDVMALAELPCNEAALQPAHEGTVDGSPFVDDLDGRGLGRFVYRVRPVDASGNAGPWSDAFPLVEVADVTPPGTPSVRSALGGEGAVVLTWRANREPDLTAYRIWCAERAGDLADVRRLPAYAEISPTAGVAVQTWTDDGLADRADRCYRLAAVDASGNVSAPTPVLRARPVDTIPPNAPAWVSAEWSGAVVVLVWVGDETGLTCQVERRADRGHTWTRLTGWLRPGVEDRRFRYADGSADPASRWIYRVRARDAAGNVATGMVERLVETVD